MVLSRVKASEMLQTSNFNSQGTPCRRLYRNCSGHFQLQTLKATGMPLGIFQILSSSEISMQWSFHLIYPMLPTAFSGPGNYSKPLRSREWQAVPKAITARKVTTAQSTLTNYNGLFFLLFLTTTSGGCADIISISGMKKSSEKWLSRDSRSPVHAGGWRTPVRCRNLYKDVLYNLRSNLGPT